MKLKLINNEDAEYAQNILNEYYKDQLIPAEKKNYIPNLKKSYGPYLGVETENGETHYLMDAASQIATIGLGFTPSAYYGVLHQEYSLSGEKKDLNLRKLNTSFHNLMKRILNWDTLSLTYCHSGAEANETALGDCYQNRYYKNANKVLAFEDSFHGRMLVSLSSTWNPVKRAPFEWDGYKTDFLKIPDTKDGVISKNLPKGWLSYWSNAPLTKDENYPFEKSNKRLVEEFNSLIKIKQKLATQEIFSVIIEPMQCEGGDRYLTNTFFNALLLLSKSYHIPVIMDEVQTGFHLGSRFFWHQEFKMIDQDNNPLKPDYIICAKKAQVGIVISKNQINFEQLPKRDEYSNSSLLRGYIQANLLNESSQNIITLNKEVNSYLIPLVKKYSTHIKDPRSNGLAFSFDFNNSCHVTSFVKERFNYGLLFYPAGSTTLRFRISTSFKNDDLKFLFERIDAICSLVFNQKEVATEAIIERPYEKYLLESKWQELIVKIKQSNQINWTKNKTNIKNLLLEDFSELELVEINKENFSNYKAQIIALEELIYEKERQTDISKFELAACQTPSYCFALIDKKKSLAGICFSGLISLFPQEKGLKLDPDFYKNNTLYMLDTTVSEEFQGKSLGKVLKMIHLIKAFSNKIGMVAGRNRQRYAKDMFNINLSLGAVEENYFKEDYSDDLEYRGCLYYKYPVSNKTDFNNNINLSNKIHTFDQFDLSKSMGALLNKICLSNFSSKDFLNDLKSQAQRAHSTLQHVFSASGQSECVDKIVKSLWVTSNKKSHLLCSFEGHYFGQGSFLSRSISSKHHSFFPTKHFLHPTSQNHKELLKEIDIYLASNTALAFFVEPLPSLIGRKISKDFLILLKEITKKHNVKLIYNETASSLYRYSSDFDLVSSDNQLYPDGSFNYLGGQAAIVYLKKELHYATPLMMISTWDGDEYSFHAATSTYQNIKNNLEVYLKDLQIFDQKLNELFKTIKNANYHLENATGFFKGPLPLSLSKMFNTYNKRHLIAPSWKSITKFNKYHANGSQK